MTIFTQILQYNEVNFSVSSKETVRMAEKTRHGYLVIADITGFTSYLAKVELEHANEILTDLLETIVKELKVLMTISKLEGDAVFAYVSQAETPGGERLLELIENTYIAFRRQREISRNNTTCTCNACKAIPTLDLKFFVHHGDYIVQEVSGIRELVGSDVNMIHRLVKNHVTEETGWNAYILFTQRAFVTMGVQIEDVYKQTESYDHLGEIQIICLDMHVRYQTILEARRVIISPDEADFIIPYDFKAPQSVVWNWITDPEKKSLSAVEHVIFSAKQRPGGRSGPGATNHCAHGKNLKGLMIETILDWRPFDYLTQETVDGKMVKQETWKLEPIPENRGTRLYLIIKMISMPLPLWIMRPIMKSMMSKVMQAYFQNAARQIEEEMSKRTESITVLPVARV